MTIYQRMEDVFRGADVPGFLKEWRRTEEYPEIPDTYCVYNVAEMKPALCADDSELFRSYAVKLWVYGREDVSAAAEALADALQLSGFALPRESDGYANLNGERRDIRIIETVYVDFGDYGQ